MQLLISIHSRPFALIFGFGFIKATRSCGQPSDFAVRGRIHNFYGRIHPDKIGFNHEWTRMNTDLVHIMGH